MLVLHQAQEVQMAPESHSPLFGRRQWFGTAKKETSSDEDTTTQVRETSWHVDEDSENVS